MWMDESREQWAKAEDSIRESVEPFSKRTAESAEQNSNDLAPITSTEEGIQIDARQGHLENAVGSRRAYC
jgi:hypothetical protein